MPQYFFDLHNDMVVEDLDGTVLPDAKAALAHAIAEVREMVSASATEQGKIDLEHWIRVRDESGHTVAEIRFQDAVRFERHGQPV